MCPQTLTECLIKITDNGAVKLIPWKIKSLYQPVWRRLTTRGSLLGSGYTITRPQLFQIDFGAIVEIGHGVHFEEGLRLHVRGHLIIGDDVYVGKNATIVCFSRTVIGDRVLIAENVSIHDEDHGGPGSRQAFVTAPIGIGHDSWICAGAIVTKGVSIGSEVTIGANAVVTQDIPTQHLGLGVPARAIQITPKI